MKKELENKISNEVLAAFLDGNATLQESQAIISALPGDSNLKELLRISRSVDTELCMNHNLVGNLPMTAMAATCMGNNYCSLECEKKILNKFNIAFDEEQVLRTSIDNGWLQEEGTAIQDIGMILESNGLQVKRRFQCTINDVATALENNEGIIAVVDGGELSGDIEEELDEDIEIGEIPDHTVAIVSCDIENRTVTLFDPNSCNAEDTYPLERFMDSWDDSANFMVTASIKE